ncbi:MAG: OFA family MFS transporter [Bacteroidales bacterium]|nr:OFA family MFS transporter [Bacteroidales bacterium]
MSRQKNRWLIAIMGTLAHLSIGTVYAWSFFQNPISETYNWNNSTTAWTFSIAIFMLGVTAAWGGKNLNKVGSQKMAMIGSFLYAFGYIISYFAFKTGNLFLLYLGFGFIGGMGLGLVYVTPVAAVSGWFPDKQGLVTGMVVMGFGLGAFVMSKLIAPFFLNIFGDDLAKTFLAIGFLMLIVLPLFSYFLEAKESPKDETVVEESVKQHILTKDYALIWVMFMLNIIAGMIFLSFQSPLLQDLLMKNGVSDPAILASRGATLIALSAIFNGLGRFFWGGVSDKIGRILTFRLLFILQILIFAILIFNTNAIVFSVGVSLILLSYGGGFGVLPSLIKERYPNLMSTIYGITLIAWSFGGIIGPQIIAFTKDRYGSEAGVISFYIGIALLSLGLVCSLILKNRKPKTQIQ